MSHKSASIDERLQDAVPAAAVEVICRRLDGLLLAIELAAARMVSMRAQDVHDRLGDRFQLPAGGRRGIERHQALRQAVGRACCAARFDVWKIGKVSYGSRTK
jgi:hypothetical protein